MKEQQKQKNITDRKKTASKPINRWLDTDRLEQSSDVLQFRLQRDALALQHSQLASQFLSGATLLFQRQLQLLSGTETHNNSNSNNENNNIHISIQYATASSK